MTADGSVVTRVMRCAAGVFSKAKTGSALSPFSDTWTRIAVYSEHAIWLWNDKYGPLNHDQREYAVELLCHALKDADKAPSVDQRYAFFHSAVTRMLNHERVDSGMKQRATRGEPILDFDEVFQAVPA